MVPISGVVMARFMMYDCEFNTVLELWDSRRKWSRISIKDKREPEGTRLDISASSVFSVANRVWE